MYQNPADLTSVNFFGDFTPLVMKYEAFTTFLESSGLFFACTDSKLFFLFFFFDIVETS